MAFDDFAGMICGMGNPEMVWCYAHLYADHLALHADRLCEPKVIPVPERARLWHKARNEKGLDCSNLLNDGAPGAIRTPDPLVRSQVLYPSELRAQSNGFALIQRVPQFGGEGGIRTLDTSLSSYAPLAGACLRPLGHLSEAAHSNVTALKGQTILCAFLVEIESLV